MLKWYYKKKAAKELSEAKPLPMGRKEFFVWAKRIIAIAQIPGATEESLMFSLSEMVLHVKATESFVSDAYFVHQLRKAAANQIAHSIFVELKEQRNAKNAQEVLANTKV